ncbi:MAG: FecR domain-containing protein [Bacteroidales bacterium]|nr:FecR domain-containing protein [Bacteroidales bacterium]
MNIDNEHIDLLIFRFLDKSATEQESAELLKWVNSHIDNKLYFQSAARQFVSMSGYSNNFDVEKAWKKNTKQKLVDTGIAASKTKILVAVLSTALILTGGCVWWLSADQKENTKQEIVTVQPKTDIYKSTDSIKEIQLANGVKLTLDANTEVEVTNDAGQNTVFVSGRALLQVPVGVNNYTINTPDGTCKLGEGLFQIEHKDSTDPVSIKVVEGTAVVTTNNTAEKVSISKNNAVALQKGKVAVRDTMHNANFMAWKTGVLEFDNTPLHQAIPLIAEYYKIVIEIETTGLENCLLNAKLDRYSFDEVKMMFEIAFNAKFREDSGKVYLSGTACK